MGQDLESEKYLSQKFLYSGNKNLHSDVRSAKFIHTVSKELKYTVLTEIKSEDPLVWEISIKNHLAHPKGKEKDNTSDIYILSVDTKMAREIAPNQSTLGLLRLVIEAFQNHGKSENIGYSLYFIPVESILKQNTNKGIKETSKLVKSVINKADGLTFYMDDTVSDSKFFAILEIECRLSFDLHIKRMFVLPSESLSQQEMLKHMKKDEKIENEQKVVVEVKKEKKKENAKKIQHSLARTFSVEMELGKLLEDPEVLLQIIEDLMKEKQQLEIEKLAFQKEKKKRLKKKKEDYFVKTEILSIKQQKILNQFISQYLLVRDGKKKKKRSRSSKKAKNKKWTLLYSAIADGWDSKTFHEKVDEKPNTYSIIKCQNGCIFGGFSPCAWNSKKKARSHPESFLFSLVNSKGTTAYRIAQNNEKSVSIYGDPNNLLVFGFEKKGGEIFHDVFITSEANKSTKNYVNLGISYNIKEFENDEEWKVGSNNLQNFLSKDSKFLPIVFNGITNIEVFQMK